MYWDGYGWIRVKGIQFYGWFLKQQSGENIISSTKKYSPEILRWFDLRQRGLLKTATRPFTSRSVTTTLRRWIGVTGGRALPAAKWNPAITHFFIIYKKWWMINERIVPHAPLQQFWRWRRRQLRTYVLHNTAENDVHHFTCGAVLRYLFSRRRM